MGQATTLALSFLGHTPGTTGDMNGQDPLYLTLNDSTGQTVSIVHPSQDAIQTNTWQDWLIPLSTLDGLQLDSVKGISIGVGYPDGSQVGSEGIVYVDDLRVGTPLVTED